ncbi:MAG: hypothetical protein ACYCV5_04575 [Acidimicrobiales bacterium]
MKSHVNTPQRRVRAMPLALALVGVALTSGLLARRRARTRPLRLGHGVWPPVPTAPGRRD